MPFPLQPTVWLKNFLDIDFIAWQKARLLKYQSDKGGKDAVDSLLFALYERTEWKASRNSSLAAGSDSWSADLLRLDFLLCEITWRKDNYPRSFF
jgi:hypothetical protein